MDQVEIHPPEGPDEIGFYTVTVERKCYKREGKSRNKTLAAGFALRGLADDICCVGLEQLKGELEEATCRES